MVQYIYLHARLRLDPREKVLPGSLHTARYSLTIILLLLGAMLFSSNVLRAAGDPALTISDSTINVMNSSTFQAPITFTSNSHEIASLSFSLDFDQGCLTFDSVTDSNGDGVPDSVITNFHANFTPSVSYDADDTTGEIDFSVSNAVSTTQALSDGTLVTFVFGVENSCRTTDGTLTNVVFAFSSNPSPSFGDTSGSAVPGTATGATVPLRFNANPTDIALTETAVDENLAKGSTVGTLSSTDVDTSDPGDTHTYSLVSGDGDGDNGSFTISGATLKTNAVFNYETKTSYAIRVRTTDSYGGAFEKQFTITVNDLNEAPTSLSLSNSSVDENQASGAVVGSFSSIDPDAGATATYSLVTGTGSDNNDSFAIVGNQLQTAASFDYEVKNTYNIRVQVTDNGSPGLTLDRIFTIKINDVNDAPVAVDDAVDPDEQVISSAASISVLANDTDEDNDTLRVQSVTTPSSGSAVTNTTTVTYTPAGNVNGVITFTYTVIDDNPSGALTDTATVTLTVVAADERGDCNADADINAGDFTAIVLEMFDTGNSGKWYEIYGGNFSGSPLGCDANTDQEVTVSDLTCTVLVAFGDETCTTPTVMAAGTTTVAKLAIGQELVGAHNGSVNVPIFLETNGHIVAAASFAMSFDESQLTFDATDADGDGVPDAVTFHTPPGMVKMVNYNRSAGRLEFALYAVTVPMPTLADGPLATVTVQVNGQASADEIPIDLLRGSLGNDEGRSVPVEVSSGSVQLAQLNWRLFLPMLQRQ